MKTNTTYPTKHPHWIDEPEYLEGLKKRKRIGISFATAFVLVLAIHLAGVGGIFAFSNLKTAKKPAVIAEAPIEKSPGPKSDSLARNEWPQTEAQPKVVATPPSVKKQVAVGKTAPVVASKPKPAAPLVAKATPQATPAPSKVDDSVAKKAFLASRSNSHSNIATAQAAPAATPVVATAPAPQVQPAPPRPSEYTLAPGDNLYMVSRRLQVSYNDLLQANGLTDPRQLRVGQKLKVPIHIASL